MKKQILLLAIAIVTATSYRTTAQVSVNINIGTQPVWGPVGYDYVEYYYIPDIDAYYDVARGRYIYMDRGRWVFVRSLPPRYRTYDLYTGYKVVVNEPRPWLHHDRYVRQYAGYRGRHGQPIIRDSRDERYYANPHHPQHNVWVSHHPGNAPRQVGPPPPRGNNGWHGNKPMPPGHYNRPAPGPGYDDHGHGHEGGPGPGPRPGPGHDDHGHDDHRGGPGEGHGHGRGH